MGLVTLQDDLQQPDHRLVETHASWVFIGKDTVWKVKKPVDFGFLDFSTIEKRKAACEAEVELNRRLAPDVYRGVSPIMRDAQGRHHVGGEGDVVDWAVEMVCLDDERRADRRLSAGLLSRDDLDLVARTLAEFHRQNAPDREIAKFGRPEVVLSNVRENFEQTRDTIGDYVSPEEAAEIEGRQVSFVEKRRELFEARIASGRVRDGHGDLRLEHVYFEADCAPTIVDCIEFNDRFRYADVCSDISFLSMDLARYHRMDLAEHFLASYARHSGDYELYGLVDFYEGYRAFVRGKVASMLATDRFAAPTTREEARKEARLHFLLALATQRRSMVPAALVITGGIIASGKSTVAERIQRLTAAPVISSDWTRKQFLGVSPTEKVHDSAWSGAYSESMTRRVYGEMLKRAESVLASGRPAVLDASFRTSEMRIRARALAERMNVPFYFVECKASEAQLRARLEDRTRVPSVSDGRAEILDDFASRWEPVEEIAAERHVIVDTARPMEETEALLASRLPAWPPGLS